MYVYIYIQPLTPPIFITVTSAKSTLSPVPNLIPEAAPRRLPVTGRFLLSEMQSLHLHTT